MELKKLGQLVKWVDSRNKGLQSVNLLGISIDKYFMPSVANVIGTDLSSYKVVSVDQFACNPMHVGRDEKMPVALYMQEDPSIVSPAYFVFEVIDSNEILPEYLMLWFRRKEFDREVWFHTDGSVRGGILWEELCELTVPVPSIAEQQEIVDVYNDIERRIALKRKINDNLEAIAMSLFKSWFIDYEPFILNAEGYPIGWNKVTLNTKLTTSTQSVNPQKLNGDSVWHYSIPAYDSERLPSKDIPSRILSNKYLVPQNAILVSKLNPETKRIWRSLPQFENAICSTEFIVFSVNKPSHRAFYYLLFNTGSFIDFLISNATGSTNSRMRVKPASSLDYEFVCPPNEIIDDFCNRVEPLLREIEDNFLEIQKLNKLLPLAVARMITSRR